MTKNMTIMMNMVGFHWFGSKSGEMNLVVIFFMIVRKDRSIWLKLGSI